MMKRFTPIGLCQKGAAAAEMALILPLAVIIMFASMESAHYFYTEHQVIKGVRDGARWGARQSFNEINCLNGTPSISSSVQDGVNNLTRTGELTGGTARVSGWEAAEVTVTVACADPSEAASQAGMFDSEDRAAIITVTADVNYDSLFGGMGIIGDSARLKATQEATVMGI